MSTLFSAVPASLPLPLPSSPMTVHMNQGHKNEFCPQPTDSCTGHSILVSDSRLNLASDSQLHHSSESRFQLNLTSESRINLIAKHASDFAVQIAGSGTALDHLPGSFGPPGVFGEHGKDVGKSEWIDLVMEAKRELMATETKPTGGKVLAGSKMVAETKLETEGIQMTRPTLVSMSQAQERLTSLTPASKMLLRGDVKMSPSAKALRFVVEIDGSLANLTSAVRNAALVSYMQGQDPVCGPVSSQSVSSSKTMPTQMIDLKGRPVSPEKLKIILRTRDNLSEMVREEIRRKAKTAMLFHFTQARIDLTNPNDFDIEKTGVDKMHSRYIGVAQFEHSLQHAVTFSRKQFMFLNMIFSSLQQNGLMQPAQFWKFISIANGSNPCFADRADYENKKYLGFLLNERSVFGHRMFSIFSMILFCLSCPCRCHAAERTDIFGIRSHTCCNDAAL